MWLALASKGPESGLKEVACSSTTGGTITTGGGFSEYYKTPPWQSAAVQSYFSSTVGASAVTG